MGNPSGDRLFLVAVLNPDFFANEYELTLADSTRSAALFSINAVMLAGTGNIRLVPGETVKAHRFFTDFLPARESGAFVGTGIDGAKVVAAFRVLRKRPVVIIVERGYTPILEGFRQTALRALTQHMIGQYQRGHGFHHRYCARQHACVVTPAS